MAIQQQLAAVDGDLSPSEFAAKTIAYAKSKTAYFNALRDAAPELMSIATGKEARHAGVGYDGRNVRSRGRTAGKGDGRRNAIFAETAFV